MPSQTRGPAVGLRAFVIAFLLANLSAVADDSPSPDGAGAAWILPAGQDVPHRLPPVDLVSDDEAAYTPRFERRDYFIGYENGFVIANHVTQSDSSVDFPFLMRVQWLVSLAAHIVRVRRAQSGPE
jgi:hypothetical protein